MSDEYTYKKPERRPEDIPTVEVIVPSGNKFLFEKPSTFGVLFKLKTMPSSLTEKAVEEWASQGIGNAEIEERAGESLANGSKEDKLQAFRRASEVCDELLATSVKPKIVAGAATKPGELSVSDIDDADLAYLFKWVASGGVAPNVATFPGRSKQDTLASASRKQVRSKAVASSGTK